MFLLKWVWQFPQNLIAVLILLFNSKREKACKGGINYYIIDKGTFGCGVSLGNYILIPRGRDDEITIKHEHGHQYQSLYFGIFYLLLIGLPSGMNNIWDRIFHKKWSSTERIKWYYNRYPEKWADKLGKVKRSFS